MAQRPPLAPFTTQSARAKVRAAEDAWNGRDPANVALAYTLQSRRRNRSVSFSGAAAIETFVRWTWAMAAQPRE